MSFDFNQNYNVTNVKHTVLNNSNGGSNTGYFKQEKNEESLVNIKEDNFDSFEKEDFDITLDDEEETSFFELIKSLILDLIDKIKSIFGFKK